jgi:hypothetical protein
MILNLIVNAFEAMSELSEGPREMLITMGRTEPCDVLVAVRDLGPGLARLEQLHHQAEGLGAGAVDLPFDHRIGRRTIVGEPQRAPRKPSFNSHCPPVRTR